MIVPPELREALRLLLLPARPNSEEACAEVLREFFDKEHIEPNDYINWTRLELGKWSDTNALSPKLSELIIAILGVADNVSGPRTGNSYARLYRKLIDDHALTHDETRAFLSHSFLIQDLANVDRLSAAQLAKLLSQRDGRVRFSRQSIGDFLDILNLPVGLTELQVRQLVEADRVEEPAYFADADIATSAEIVATTAIELGFVGELGGLLRALYIEVRPATFTPYLQILHYQCVIAEFYDHALTDLYEFAPRGQAAGWLFAQYPQAMATAGNPFLNNAKSVERATMSWVRSKRIAERPGAAALLAILEGLEVMGFAARRELARAIRLWLLRAMRLAEPLLVPLPASYDMPTWVLILRRAAVANTGTFGVLEQRIVDAAATLRLPELSGWRSRGIGASVNATNVSQRKIGDCDFQHAGNRTLEAFEAHGGDLSQVYVEEHLRTMRKIIPARTEELSGIADLAEWQATVLFIAHTISAPPINAPLLLAGLSVEIRTLTYQDIVEELLQNATAEHLDQYILTPIREKRTPVQVREALNALSAPAF